MSRADKMPTADMLLVEARRRRLLAGRTTRDADLNASRDVAADPDQSHVLVAEEDAFIEEAASDRGPPRRADSERAPLPRAALRCYRPLTTVTLARLAWSGVIDHPVLHEAIACVPVKAGASAPNLLRFAEAQTTHGAPHDEPSLYVGLGEDDVEALERALEGAPADIGGRLASAALLPEVLIGAPARAAYAASQALGAYRGAALVAAWREIMGAPALAEVMRDRDSAAVRLLSTLRALLGEA